MRFGAHDIGPTAAAPKLVREESRSSNTLWLGKGLKGRRPCLGGAVAASLILVSALSLSCGSGDRYPTSAASAPADTPLALTVNVVKVISQKLHVTVRLPGELQPYELVAIYPKVTGFVKWIGVDRGSHVKEGELMARLEAPELVSERAEAQAKLQSAESQLAAAQAKMASDQSTYERLKAASATPGVVAGNDLVVAQKTFEADRAQCRALGDNVNAARQALRGVAEIEAYLQVKAPFDGIVTERNVHPGALVGPVGGPGVTVPMLRIEKVSRLRLVVPVPEAYVAGIPQGTKVDFAVPAFPGGKFTGTVARIAHSVEVKTRTMPVELDVTNSDGRLAPGMFPQVLWPVERPGPTLFVPSSAVARTTERTFVVRIREGKAEWVDIKPGMASGNLIEVFGELREGDSVAARGTDELRPGTRVTPRPIGSS